MPVKDFTSNQDDSSQAGPPPMGGVLLFGGPMPQPGPPSTPSGRDQTEPGILINYNERFADAEPTMFRDRIIEQTLSVLIGKNKPNAVLAGPAGVGKTKIVEDIARRIAVGDCLIPDQMASATIYELPISDIVSGSNLQGQIESKLKEVIDFAQDPANDAIVFIDEIHLVVNDRDSSYSKIADILKPALARGDLRVIGATTSQEVRDLDNDPAFNRRFTRLVVDELTRAQTVAVLGSVRAGLVAHYQDQVKVSDEVLASVVTIADENSRAGFHRPDGAITLLDRAMADRVLGQKRMISDAEKNGDTDLVRALKSVTPLQMTTHGVSAVATRMLTGHATRHVFDIDVLRQELSARIQGQDKALEQLTDRLAREQMGLFPRTTPITWMLAGASGVGKTQAAKLIAQAVTDQEPIILNMTEYNSPASVQRIIGSPAGYVGFDSNAELPFDALDANPHRVILLDEFEKADQAVQRLFLSAFDEGYIRTSRGKLLDFSKAIVFATTNAARDQLEQRRIGFGNAQQEVSHQSLTKALAQHFEAELLGRFTLLVGFSPITEETYRDILTADYDRSRQELALNRRHMAARLPDQIPADEIEAMVAETFVPSQGARPAAKAIQSWIEDHLIAQQSAVADDDTDDEGEQP